jgi:hypothetical protein
MTTSTTTATALALALMEAMASGAPEDFARLVAPDAHNREAASEPPASRVPGPEAGTPPHSGCAGCSPI